MAHIAAARISVALSFTARFGCASGHQHKQRLLMKHRTASGKSIHKSLICISVMQGNYIGNKLIEDGVTLPGNLNQLAFVTRI